jgi:hypothetical protein
MKAIPADPRSVTSAASVPGSESAPGAAVVGHVQLPGKPRVVPPEEANAGESAALPGAQPEPPLGPRAPGKDYPSQSNPIGDGVDLDVLQHELLPFLNHTDFAVLGWAADHTFDELPEFLLSTIKSEIAQLAPILKEYDALVRAIAGIRYEPDRMNALPELVTAFAALPQQYRTHKRY